MSTEPEIDIVATVEGFESSETPKTEPKEQTPAGSREPTEFPGYVILRPEDTIQEGDVRVLKSTLKTGRNFGSWAEPVDVGRGILGGRITKTTAPDLFGHHVAQVQSEDIFLRADKIRQAPAAPLKKPRTQVDNGALAVGTRVKLVTDSHGDNNSNPVWGGRSGAAGGTVMGFRGDPRDRKAGFVNSVCWDIGWANDYKAGDLAVLTTEEQLMSADNVVDQSKPIRSIMSAPQPGPTMIPGPVPPVVRDWPEAATKNREAWLLEAARRIAQDPTMPERKNLLFSVGYGKGGTRGKRLVSVSDNATGDGKQVFVRPTVDGKRLAATCIRTALQEIGEIALARLGENDVNSWPDYPQPDVKVEQSKQATCLLKCHCEKCGYTVRTTARWLDKYGPPICPNLTHPGCLMVRG